MWENIILTILIIGISYLLAIKILDYFDNRKKKPEPLPKDFPKKVELRLKEKVYCKDCKFFSDLTGACCNKAIKKKEIWNRAIGKHEIKKKYIGWDFNKYNRKNNCRYFEPNY